MTVDAYKLVENLFSARSYLIDKKGIRRVDALEKALGTVKYTADYIVENAFYLEEVRSLHPHANIRGIDLRGLASLPFLAMGFTADAIPGEKFYGPVIPDQPIMAIDRVRFVGECVALVAAETPEDAEEAAEHVKVDYEPLRAIFSPNEARSSDAPKIHQNGNEVRRCRIRKGDITRGFAESDIVIDRQYETRVIEHAPLETAGCFALPSKDLGVTIVGNMQDPVILRSHVARMLGKSPDKVTVVQAATGGAFGTLEETADATAAKAALVATMTGRPAVLIYSREKSFAKHTKRHPFTMKYKFGATKAGRLNAAEMELLIDTGAYASKGPTVTFVATVHATGPYEIPNVKVDASLVYTNNVPAGAMRGFGNPQVHFAAESIMDELAESLSLDPLDFRLRNILRPGSRTATGQVLDNSVGLEECLVKVAKAVGWKRRREELRAVRDRYQKRGLGIACMFHGNGFAPEKVDSRPDRSSVSLRIERDGRVVYKTSLVEYGTAALTGHVLVMSKILDLPIECFRLEKASTDEDARSGPTWASRGTMMVGNAAALAAFGLKEEIRKGAALILGASTSDIKIENGKMFASSSEQSMTMEQLAEECYKRGVKLAYVGTYNQEQRIFDPETMVGTPYPAYTYGAVVAEVEVDSATGYTRVLKITSAHDVGRVINLQGLETQIEGAIAQGIGYALMEETACREGAILNPNYADYFIPTSVDMPEMQSILVEYPTSTNPLGAKVMGEPPLVAIAPSIVNAISHACGARVRCLPATPERVLLH